jgi:hypothetical protein
LFGRPVRNERAYTLIEVVITVWIMGAIVVTLMGSLFTMIKANDLTNRKASLDLELRRWTDAIREAPYQECASSTADIALIYGYPGSEYTDLWPYATTMTGTTPGTTDVPLAIIGFTDIKYLSTSAADPLHPTVTPMSASWPFDTTDTTEGPTGTCHDPGEQQITVWVQTSTTPTIHETATFTKRDGGSQDPTS